MVSLFLIFSALNAGADDVYMKLTGTRSSGKSIAGVWSDANCYPDLQTAFPAISSGDTLTIDDGTYTGWENAIWQWNYPPSGTPDNFIVIRAKNIPCQNGVACNQPLKVHFDGASNAIFSNGNYPENDPAKRVEYVKFWGIRWDGIGTFTNWNHIYFKQVASMGIEDGNTATVDIDGQYNLLEDVVAFGKGRYKFLFYDISRDLQENGPGNNLCRRCVARHDWAKKEDSSGDPIATFSSYYLKGTALLNPIDIDSNMPAYWMKDPGEIDGAFLQPVDDSAQGPHNFSVRGGIVVNSAMGMGLSASTDAGVTSTGNNYTDIAGINVAGGFLPRGGGPFNRITLVNVNSNNFAYRNATQKSQVLALNDGIFNWGDLEYNVTNSVFKSLAGNGLYGNGTNDYMNLFGITGGNYSGVTPAQHLISTDPSVNGLLYPVRIEPGSSLSSAGSGGGQIGANILNKLGVDGTFKGDPDWNTPQGSLWPWPLEEWIKAEMQTSDYAGFCTPYAGTAKACPASYATDAYRGFASKDKKRLDGINQVTLTSYIWESLGNPIPTGIYVDLTPPAAPTGLSVH